ncbi:MAG: TolC family protein [Gammaproteobacteria bacterium]
MERLRLSGFRNPGVGAVVVMTLSLALTGCASTPRARGTEAVDTLMKARGRPVAAWPTSEGDNKRSAVDLSGQPLSRERAIELAFTRNPRVRELYAELGIAEADVVQAGRLSNPRLGYVSLRPEGGGLSQITRSVSLNFTDALLWTSRVRMARGVFERARETVAGKLLDVAARAETAWFDYVAAQQIAELRRLVSEAGQHSAEFAGKLNDAGNLSPGALALERAEAAESRITAARAKADEVRARKALAEAVGISARESWIVPAKLPAPPAALSQASGSESQLLEQALATRLDLAAARREVTTLQDMTRVTRRFRWLGDVEGGYEKESETDGARLKGPSLALELPLFNQNQGGVLRAQAESERAQARLAALELTVRNEVSASLDRIAAAQQIAESYRTALVPQREAVVERTQEEHNYMLVGAFDLLQAKRAQLNAYQEYLESVRDYWVARTELRHVVGGGLDDVDGGGSTLDVEGLLSPAAERPGEQPAPAEQQNKGDAR